MPGHDEMVQRPDVDQRQRLLERRRQELVGAGRLGDAARMVVREDDGRGIAASAALTTSRG